MTDREPESMQEFFADGLSEGDDQYGEPTDDQEMVAGEPEVVEGQGEESPEDGIDPVQARVARLEQELANRDQQMAQFTMMMQQAEEAQRQREFQAAQERWRIALATGDMSQDEVERERATLLANHYHARMQRVERENQQLRQYREMQEEAQAKEQAISLIASEHQLTAREVAYIRELDDPYAMERLAARLKADRGQAANQQRQQVVQQRRGTNADRATPGQRQAKEQEPGSMFDYFKSIRR